MEMLDENALNGMKRKDLQKLCKERGIKANSKTAVLLQALKTWSASQKKNDCEVQAAESEDNNQNDSKYDMNTLQSMSRKELQRLCKENEIKANSKTTKLITDLFAFFSQSRGEADKIAETSAPKEEIKESKYQNIKKKKIPRALANLADSLSSGARDIAPSKIAFEETTSSEGQDRPTKAIPSEKKDQKERRQSARLRLSNCSVDTVKSSPSNANFVKGNDSTLKKSAGTKKRTRPLSALERLSNISSAASANMEELSGSDDDSVLVEHTFGGLTTVKKKVKRNPSARIFPITSPDEKTSNDVTSTEQEIPVPKRRRSARLSKSKVLAGDAPVNFETDTSDTKEKKKKKKALKKRMRSNRGKSVPDWNKIHNAMFEKEESIATTYEKIMARKTPKAATKSKKRTQAGAKKRAKNFKGVAAKKPKRPSAFLKKHRGGPKYYGQKRKRRRSCGKEDVAAFDAAMEDGSESAPSSVSAPASGLRRKHVIVPALRRKPFVAKKSNRPPTKTKEFNLSSSNFGSRRGNKKSNDSAPAWEMKTTPYVYEGDSLFSPTKRSKRKIAARRRERFNLEESLKKPLTWEPKKGPIRG
eukprot:g734.t1